MSTESCDLTNMSVKWCWGFAGIRHAAKYSDAASVTLPTASQACCIPLCRKENVSALSDLPKVTKVELEVEIRPASKSSLFSLYTKSLPKGLFHKPCINTWTCICRRKTSSWCTTVFQAHLQHEAFSHLGHDGMVELLSILVCVAWKAPVSQTFDFAAP